MDHRSAFGRVADIGTVQWWPIRTTRMECKGRTRNYAGAASPQPNSVLMSGEQPTSGKFHFRHHCSVRGGAPVWFLQRSCCLTWMTAGGLCVFPTKIEVNRYESNGAWLSVPRHFFKR